MFNRVVNYGLDPTCYIPDNKIKEPFHPPLVKYSSTEKDDSGNPKAIGITWHCGEPIYLEFRLTGNVVYDDEDNSNYPYGYEESIVNYLQDKNLILSSKSSKNNAKFVSNSNRKIFQVLIYNTDYNVVGWYEIPTTKIEYINENYCKFKVLINDFYPAIPTKGEYLLELNLINKDTKAKETLINKEICKLFID